MPVNGPKVFTVRKLVTLTPEQHIRAQRLAHKYNGSVNEVLREGIGALEREHTRAMGIEEPPACATGTCGHIRPCRRQRARED